MTYTVLARKYRPQRFEDLIGQESISRTLQNAIQKNRVAHAFLFTGARGVGKTTSARILAKALNCEQGPTQTPCNLCELCIGITQGNDMDVIEMDGASHNSVDDVRRLQETMPFRPTKGRHRIIIIDEVHMLSTGAFNALLKTLEEPPAHVKFIFATTEVHKVPITIRSRCQRYDFKLVPRQVIAEHIRKVLAEEQIQADDAAIDIVTREAAGSVRDALTLLDQFVAGGRDTLEGDEMARVLGLSDRSGVVDSLFAVLVGDPLKVLENVRRIAEHGGDCLHFAKQMLELCRELVVMKIDSAASHYVDLPADERSLVSERLAEVDVLEVERTFVGLSNLTTEIGRATMPFLSLEMGLLRLATRPRLRSIESILNQIESGWPSESSRKEPSGQGSAVTQTAHTLSKESNLAPQKPTTESYGAGQKNHEEPMRTLAPHSVKTPPASTGDPLQAAEMAEKEQPTKLSAPPPTSVQPARREFLSDMSWEVFVTELRERRPALGAVLEHGILINKTSELWVLGFAEGSFFGRQAEQPEAKEAMRALLEERLGNAPKIEVRVYQERQQPQETLVQKQNKEREEARESMKKEALTHPAVIDTMQVFSESATPPDIRLHED